LAKQTFAWMIREARACSLEVDEAAYDRELQQIRAAPDPCGELHNSLKGLWRIAQLIPYRSYSATDSRRHWHCWPVKPPRNVLRDADKSHVYLHSSALERLKHCSDYRPANLPHDEAMLRKTFQIEG